MKKTTSATHEVAPLESWLELKQPVSADSKRKETKVLTISVDLVDHDLDVGQSNVYAE